MAKLLLERLLEPDPSKRYTADKILKHPWITRNINDNIPLTYLEIWRGDELKKKMTEVNKSFF
jgi:serine/threonine protein kinase